MRDVFDWLPAHQPARIVKGADGFDVMAGGDGWDILFGKGGDDLLIGDPDVNTGGARDILVGGSGADSFHFQFVPQFKYAADVILDFKPGLDTLSLAFGFLPVDPDKPEYGYAPDLLDPGSFTYGKGPKDGDDFVIYRKKTGALFLDADGTGPEAMHKIAILANKAKIDAGDIIVG
jgi:serralysin